jgi:hypothetical protein
MNFIEWDGGYDFGPAKTSRVWWPEGVSIALWHCFWADPIWGVTGNYLDGDAIVAQTARALLAHCALARLLQSSGHHDPVPVLLFGRHGAGL